jgi:hypothetical protein
VGSPKRERISRTAQASVMKAMIRISPPQRGQQQTLRLRVDYPVE